MTCHVNRKRSPYRQLRRKISGDDSVCRPSVLVEHRQFLKMEKEEGQNARAIDFLNHLCKNMTSLNATVILALLLHLGRQERRGELTLRVPTKTCPAGTHV